ncbi:hypothetical protein [Ramlibacter sp. Leaf400]|uniref:hypothetical protein n=1 Tax=Ramlibacter sp. Leaf400 TaxID=1736365 RepID=UPI0006F85CF1|nr:hypothetical protein [Ramlibacter sp. Leaf400]KQT10957.1 hypothetical protein ASG30_09165 [Ramlibacter sp. Leaf400]
MSSLPDRTDVAGTPSNSTAKTALAALFDFVAQRMARGTTGAGSASSAELASARDSLGVPLPNWLYNPDGAIYQRTVAATADDTYAEDRWYVLTQTASVTPSQQSNPENGYRYASRLTQSQAAAQRMGYAQIIEGKDAIPLRGKTVTFGGRFKLSTSANLRLAILAWTGTEDSVTSDVVNDWTNATIATGAFFASSNLSLVATSSTALTAATAGDASVSGAVPVGTTNLIVFYWTEATAAQNVTLDAWGRRLIESSYLNEHIRRSHSTELDECRRFYERWTHTSANLFMVNFVAGGQAASHILGRVEKRTSPSITIHSQTLINCTLGVFANNAIAHGITITSSAAGLAYVTALDASISAEF